MGKSNLLFIFNFNASALKKFIKNITLFILLFSSILFVVDTALSTWISQKADFSSPTLSQATYAVLGHSQPECAFNDSLIENFVNLASVGESYFYTYRKLQQIIAQQPQLKTLLLDFSNNQLTLGSEEAIWADRFIQAKLPSYLPFIDFQEKWLLFQKNPSGFLDAYALSWNSNLNRFFKSDYQFQKALGGYRSLQVQHADSLAQLAEKSATKEKSSAPLDPLPSINIHYLNQILALCKAHQIKVYLIRLPVHSAFSAYHRYEERHHDFFRNELAAYEFLDFSQFPLQVEEFADLEHLNDKGARKFSTFFQKLVEKGLFQAADKQRFIEKEMVVF